MPHIETTFEVSKQKLKLKMHFFHYSIILSMVIPTLTSIYHYTIS